MPDSDKSLSAIQVVLLLLAVIGNLYYQVRYSNAAFIICGNRVLF